MRLAVYAKQMGVSYKTAYRWYKSGILDAYQLPTGTIIVINPAKENSPTSQTKTVALYARVSSNDQKADLDRQLDRLRTYVIVKCYSYIQETA